MKSVPNPSTPQSKPVVTPTDARQASPKQANFRVLKMSMIMAVAVGIVLVGAFWFTTPDDVEGVPERSSVNTGVVPSSTSPPATTVTPVPETAPLTDDSAATPSPPTATTPSGDPPTP